MTEKILFESAQLYVRTWHESDFNALYHIMSQPLTHRDRTKKRAWTHEDTERWLTWHLEHSIGWEVGTFNCPLILRATDQLIGSVGLNPYLEKEGIPEIEWTIDPEYWGKGYATEIGRSILSYGFEKARFPAIMGFALTTHGASRRVMEKIGMSYLCDREDNGLMKSFYKIEAFSFTA